MVQYSYTLHYDPDTANTEITDDVEEIEFIETGTGEVRSAKIKLNARRGKFTTAAPILAAYDLLKLVVTDEDSVVKTFVYEVDRIIPVKNAKEGRLLEVECLGQEHWLQKIDVAKQFYFASAQQVIEQLSDFYNDTIGTSQPAIQDHDDVTENQVPRWTANDYLFGTSEIKAYDAMIEVAENLGASIAAGGSGDFWEIFFETNVADLTKINLRAFSSGSSPAAGSEVTITDTVAVNEAPMEGGIDAPTGTLIKAWGAAGVGTLPQSVQDFNGQLEAFLLDPAHIPGVTYPAGVRVQVGGVHYEADVETLNTPPHADWTAKDFDDIHGAANGYSEWTEGQAAIMKNNGSDPAGAFKGLGCWDSNLVIEDGTYFQTWAHVKSITDGFDVNYKYGDVAGGVYRGLRCLVNGTGTGAFASNDKYGKSFDGNVAIYDGSDWIVMYETSNLWRCAIRGEGKVYEKQTGTWTDISAVARENHCFHLVNSISQGQGYNSTSDGTGTYGDNSAVEWEWVYTAFAAIPGAFFTSDGYYKIGAWANIFTFPFPDNGYNAKALGELYGNNSTKKEPATLDTNNMHLTRDGSVGFNNTTAEDLGPLDAIQFWSKFKWTDLVGALNLEGNFKMRCFMYDNQDNVVIKDFTIPFNDVWKHFTLPFSSFEPYRARIPKSLGNIAANIFTKDLEILNRFQWKNIKQIGIQWQEVYDKEGRYHPQVSRAVLNSLAGTSTIILSVDGLCFTKPLLKTSGVVSDRVNEPPALQLPDVSNSVQLQQIVNSQLEIEQFQHKQFQHTMPGKFDINFGDTYFLNDSLMINDADTRTADSGGSANTIRLVAKRITYKITKGRFSRTILGIKRIVT